MTTKTISPISVRINAQQRKDLDSVAKMRDRDRSYIIQEAITQYLELHAWQITHIKEGVCQADAGNFVSEAMVKKLFTK